MSRPALLCLILILLAAGVADAQTREEKVRADRKKIEADGFWIYNDLDKGFAEARRTGKPMLVVLRCIPCEECVKLDDDLIHEDKRVRPLLEKFVRVRVVSTNGLDLSLFQFDYDQSFAAFLLNGDGTIYGRFGTRSHRTNWAEDVSLEGLARALEGALELHGQYPRNRASLAGKKGPAPVVPTPEKLPTLKGKYGAKLDYAGKVVPSCIHCHQIGEALRQQVRDNKQAMPDELLFPYPHPRAIGLILDPKQRATVLRALKDTPASQAGFSTGDEIVSLAGQPILSIADVQWVLQQTPATGGTVDVQVRRHGRLQGRTLRLEKGWRQKDDLSWRASTWALRRMATGGLLLEEMPAADRKKADIEEGKMALRVKHIGQYGAHAAAQRAGFRKGDILIAFDGRTDLGRESDLLAHALRQRQAGERIEVTVWREGKKIRLTLPMQK